MLTQTLSVHRLEQNEANCFSAYYQNAGLELQKEFGLSIYHLNGAVCLAAPGMDILMFNRVIGAGLNTPLTRHQLKEIIHFYRISGSPRFFLQLSPDVITPTILEFLESNGFRHYNNWSKYYKELYGHQQVPESNFTVARVQPYEAELFADIVSRSFDMEYGVKNLITSTYGKPGWHYYFALAGGRPVAAASMFINGHHAQLAIAATLPEARDQGAQNLLIAVRLNQAIAEGCGGISAETAEDTPEKSSPSSRNMQRAGFTLAYNRPNFIYQF